jgi:hypothetical protein
MHDRTEEAKNTSAVLIAATYEGLIRRMGEEFASVSDRLKLEDVIGALKARMFLKAVMLPPLRAI